MHDNLSCILTQREDPSFDVFSQLDWSKSTPEKNRAPTQITPKQSPEKLFELEQPFSLQYTPTSASSFLRKSNATASSMACDDFLQDFEFGNDMNFTDSLHSFVDGLCDLGVEWNADTFRNDYNEAVNESIEYELDDNMYDALTKDCCSPLYERLVEQLTTLDDLDVGDQSENTYKTTYTAIRSFNFWWMNHEFLRQNQTLYAIKFKYGDYLDGFQVLCSASHEERNVLFSHYVAKMVKRRESQKDLQNGVNFVLGRTKRGYLNSLMRGMKMYEHLHHLTNIYGRDWSWQTDLAYKQTQAVLVKVTKKNELAVSPSKIDCSSAYLSDEQFDVLHSFTWDLSEDISLSFAERLKHKAAYFCQDCAVFDCLRGRDELANMLMGEFTVLPDQKNILFQMKRDFKSCKPDKTMKIVHKPSLIIPGERPIQLLQQFFTSHRPTNLKEHIQDRLLLRPKDRAQPTDAVWYDRRVLGKDFTDSIVSLYVQMLRDKNHPLFLEDFKYTNSSLRKFHLEKLADANAPLLIQQASLAQNTRHYSRGAHNLEKKLRLQKLFQEKEKVGMILPLKLNKVMFLLKKILNLDQLTLQ